MISLKKILQDGGASEQTLSRVLQLLLQGLVQHAIEGDPEDLAAFRASIQKVMDSLDRDPDGSQLLVEAGVQVPDAVSIIGYDDGPMSATFIPWRSSRTRVWRVSSQAIASAPASVSSARSVTSCRLPIGVGHTTSRPAEPSARVISQI